MPKIEDSTSTTRTEIDSFILARLKEQGSRFAPEADAATLIRRLSYDLIGLPPTLEEIDAFMAASAIRPQQAYEELVDRLLASPRFGERWGRHWLDVARFGESITLRGTLFKEAWRYRDYVIETFNRDVPYDRFLREQIAGDLLPAESVAQKRRQLIATTFLVLGNTNLEQQDKQQLVMDVVDEQLDVISKGFLAQTLTCALPRSQVRPHSNERLLRPGRDLAEHQNAQTRESFPVVGDSSSGACRARETAWRT